MATGDLGNQVELQREINKLLAARTEILKKNKRLEEEFCNAAKCAAKDQKSSADSAAELNSNMQDSTSTGEDLSDALEGASEMASGLAWEIQKFMASLAPGPIGWVLTAIASMASAFQKVTGFISGAFDMIGSLIGGIWDVGVAIVSLPFDFLNLMVAKASEFSNNWWVAAEATQEIKEHFGSIASNEGRAAMRALEGFNKAWKESGKYGPSQALIWGQDGLMGPEALAAKRKEFLELTKAMGPAMGILQHQMGPGFAATAMRFTRNVGFTKDAFAALASEVASRGQNMEEEMNAISTEIANMSKMSGFSAKEIGRAYGEMTADVSNFGHMDRKSKMSSILWAKRLGMETKALGGILDKFLNFDKTAEAAAMMSQAFGANVDVMKLVKSQNPAESIDEMRRAFFATGRTLKDLDYAERKILENASGLKGKNLEAAFAIDRQGTSWGELADDIDKANAKQLSQVEAIRELNKGMKSLIRHIKAEGKTFMDNFINGFEKGMARSKNWRKSMFAISNALISVTAIGQEMGRTFMDEFKGMDELFSGIQKMFSPKRFKKHFRGILTFFKQFLRDIKREDVNIRNLTKGLFDNILKVGKEFFMSGGEGNKMAMEGGWTILETIGNVLLGAGEWIFESLMTGLTSAFNIMTGWLKREGWKQISPGIRDAFTTAIEYVTKALSSSDDGFISVWKKESPRLAKAWDALLKEMNKGGGVKDQLKEWGAGMMDEITTVMETKFKEWWGAFDLKAAIAAGFDDAVDEAQGKGSGQEDEFLVLDLKHDLTSMGEQSRQSAKDLQDNFKDASGGIHKRLALDHQHGLDAWSSYAKGVTEELVYLRQTGQGAEADLLEEQLRSMDAKKKRLMATTQEYLIGANDVRRAALQMDPSDLLTTEKEKDFAMHKAKVWMSMLEERKKDEADFNEEIKQMDIQRRKDRLTAGLNEAELERVQAKKRYMQEIKDNLERLDDPAVVSRIAGQGHNLQLMMDQWAEYVSRGNPKAMQEGMKETLKVLEENQLIWGDQLTTNWDTVSQQFHKIDEKTWQDMQKNAPATVERMVKDAKEAAKLVGKEIMASGAEATMSFETSSDNLSAQVQSFSDNMSTMEDVSYFDPEVATTQAEETLQSCEQGIQNLETYGVSLDPNDPFGLGEQAQMSYFDNTAPVVQANETVKAIKEGAKKVKAAQAEATAPVISPKELKKKEKAALDRAVKVRTQELSKIFDKKTAEALAKKETKAKEATQFLKSVDVARLLEANRVIMAVNKINQNRKFITRASSVAKKIKNQTDKLSMTMVKTAAKLETQAVGGSAKAVAQVKEVVANLNKMTEALNRVRKGVDLEVALDNFSEAANPGGGSVGKLVERKKDFVFNINITMDVGDVVQAMAVSETTNTRLAVGATCPATETGDR